MRTPTLITKEIQSMDLANLTVLSRNLALSIKDILDEIHNARFPGVSQEFVSWVGTLTTYELLEVQIGVLYRMEQVISQEASRGRSPFK